MPNWCEFDITIEGPAAVAVAFAEAVANHDGSLMRAFLPMPDDLSQTTSGYPADPIETQQAMIAKYGAATWYEWALKAWGCKWADRPFSDPFAIEIQCYDGVATIEWSGETPWSPPIEGLTTIMAAWPDLEVDFRYFEQGMGFNGRVRFERGHEVYNQSGYYAGGRGG